MTLRFARLGAPGRAHGVAAGHLRLSEASGGDRVPFRGRTSSGLLAPGRYLVRFTATGIGGVASRSALLRFTVARG